MRNKIKNTLDINVCGIDLTTLTNIEFYVKQGNLFFQYTPEIIDYNNMIIEIPYEDTLQLVPYINAELQFAFTDDNGNVGASNIERVIIQELIKEGGYNP